MLAKLAHDSDPAFRHEQQAFGHVDAKGSDVQARQYGLGVLPLFN